ncbi:hypothetical protein HPP92_012044 [Vanilla planifolia]|uniref:SAC domain-containing protein n=1 Tax=Vanilla planifolia TaxID=51239 RepID=A0A835R1U3_VANPL|nr:hypothetical protein HPP92_012044 [Vanilla planifolia]
MEAADDSRGGRPRRSMCSRDLELQEFPNKYVIRSMDPELPHHAFSISRSDGAIQLLTGDPNIETHVKVSSIYGVVGILRLLTGAYVLVITSREEVGSYLGFPIYRAKSLKFLSCTEALETSEARAFKLDEGRFCKPLWKQADPRYIWNRSLLEDLIEHKVRGSIPLLWEQIVDLSYKPIIRIIEHEETTKVVARHFNDLIQRYGAIIAVDLTNNNGDEGQLSCAFASEMEKLPQVRYVSFDFHHHCAKGNFDNLQVLYDEIIEDVHKQGFFLIDAEVVLLEQSGVVRSNCIDCLDRTNVTQSYLARKSLNSQLQQIGAFSSSDCISMFGDIHEMFKILWAEHGDEISLEYAGTHALKGDLVRYGRQTIAGLFKDGITALSRYYLNNFQDGLRQDALDLISGRYDINRSSHPLQPRDSLSYVPVASALIIGGLTVTSFSLNQGRHPQNFLSSALLAGLAFGVMAAVKANGRQLCSRPRFCGLL